MNYNYRETELRMYNLRKEGKTINDPEYVALVAHRAKLEQNRKTG